MNYIFSGVFEDNKCHSVEETHTFSTSATVWKDIKKMFGQVNDEPDISSFSKVMSDHTLEAVTEVSYTHTHIIRGMAEEGGNVLAVLCPVSEHFELAWASLTSNARNVLRGNLLAEREYRFLRFKDVIDNVVFFHDSYEDTVEETGESVTNYITECERVTSRNLDKIYIDLKIGRVLRLKYLKDCTALALSDIQECEYSEDGKSCTINLNGGKRIKAARAGTIVGKSSTSEAKRAGYLKERFISRLTRKGKARNFICSRVIYAVSRSLSYSSLTEHGVTYDIDHIDNNPLNNDIANLQLVTGVMNSKLKDIRTTLELIKAEAEANNN